MRYPGIILFFFSRREEVGRKMDDRRRRFENPLSVVSFRRPPIYIEILSLLDGEKEKKEGRKGRARGRRLGRNFPGGRLSNTPVSASPDNHWNAIKHDL